MKNYDHLIEINEDERLLIIYRVDGSGNKVLFTSTTLPEIDIDSEPNSLKEFAAILGENILLDSPIIRRIYGL